MDESFVAEAVAGELCMFALILIVIRIKNRVDWPACLCVGLIFTDVPAVYKWDTSDLTELRGKD